MLKEEIKFIDKSDEAVKKTVNSWCINNYFNYLVFGKHLLCIYPSWWIVCDISVHSNSCLRPFHKLWMILALMGFVISQYY
jgi:hypothetical protein